MKKYKLKKNFIAFLSSTFIQAIINYFLISFFSHILTKEKFGEYTIYLSILPILTTLALLGIDSSVNIYYHKLSLRKYKVLLFNTFFILLPFISLLILLLGFLFSPFISSLFKLEKKIIILLAIVSVFQSYILSYLSLLQTQGKSISYFKFFSFNLLLSNIIGIFLFLLKKSLSYYFLGIGIGNFIFSLLVLYKLYIEKFIFPIINLKVIYKILKYGIPLIPNAVGSYIFFMSDRFFLSYFYDNQEVAYYSVGLYISAIILMFNHALVKAWNPYLFNHLKSFKTENKKKIVKISYIIFLLYIVLFIIIVASKEIIFNVFFPTRLSYGLVYVDWIALGYMFIGFFKVFSGYLFYLEKTFLISTISFSSAILNIILNYIFIKLFGPLGVAYATACTMVIFTLIVFIFIQKYYKLPWIFYIK